MFYDQLKTPIGNITIVATESGLKEILWPSDLKKSEVVTKLQHAKKSARHPLLGEAKRQLTEYFSHKRNTFDLPLSPEGTVFQKKAWKQLQKIPYGETISYGEQAKRLGDSKKARAVEIVSP